MIDKDFSLQELNTAIKGLKNNKACGEDGIPNELWKNLTIFQKSNLLKTFNKLYRENVLPPQWSNVLISPIYKKSDPNSPSNYRPISLLNTSLKLFTQLLCNRVIEWATDHKKISSVQFAYQKNKGCEDAVFTLSALINKRIHMQKKNLYSTFIDLSQAFDSVEHSLLWSKLAEKGLSDKFINICRTIYFNAKAKVKTQSGLTSEIPINRGVLQGETLSPVLFILFIDDIVKNLQNSRYMPFKMGSLKIHILIYADDMVLLAHTPFELQNKINLLSAFFLEHNLKVNTSKTKVMIFARRQPQKTPSLHWNGVNLEIVQSYTYLGVPVNSTMNQNFTFLHFKSQSKIAAANLFNLFYKANISNFKIQQQLFNSLVRSVTTYCAPIWAINNPDCFEVIEANFLKQLFRLPKFTPRWLIFLETNFQKIKIAFQKQVLQFWRRVLAKPVDNPTRACYEELLHLHHQKPNSHNWITSLKKITTEINEENLWSSDLITPKDISRITHKCTNLETEADIHLLNTSSRFSHYKALKTHIKTETYLTANISMTIKIFIMHFRFGISHFIHKNKTVHLHQLEYQYKLVNNPRCSTCNKNEIEDAFHLLFSCPHYWTMQKYIRGFEFSADISSLNYINLICAKLSIKEWQKFYSVFQTILKTRKFLSEYCFFVYDIYKYYYYNIHYFY